MVKCKIVQHESPSYGPRTYANAAQGDVTLAFAVDFSTAGERLTKKAAGHRKIIEIPLMINRQTVMIQDNLDMVVRATIGKNIKCINVAGNGIYTMKRYGWDQDRVNQYVFTLLYELRKQVPFESIVCGGQTGADIAGAVAAFKLDVPCLVRMPFGYKQRYEDGKDVDMDPMRIARSIHAMAERVVIEKRPDPKFMLEPPNYKR